MPFLPGPSPSFYNRHHHLLQLRRIYGKLLVYSGTHLDAAACHAATCTSAYGARTRKHNNIARVLATAALEAGLEVSRELDTHSLLLSELLKADCKRIFPKKANAAYKTAFNALVAAQAKLQDPACPHSHKEKSLALQHHIDTLATVSNKRDITGLRLDLALVNPLTNETQWIDVTSVNTAAPSYVNQEFHRICDEQRSSTTSSNLCIPPVPRHPNPSLVAREARKCDKYSRLISIASRQVFEHKRPKLPIFSPFAISSTGELGPGANLLQEWIVNQYHAKCAKAGLRPDGLTTKELVKDFRHRLKVETQLAVAIGNGNLICTADLPRGGL